MQEKGNRKIDERIVNTYLEEQLLNGSDTYIIHTYIRTHTQDNATLKDDDKHPCFKRHFSGISNS